MIFGSWAARYHGPAGPPPNDIDIAVIGHMDPFDARVTGTALERQLGVPAQVVTFTAAEWAHPEPESFTETIQQRDTVTVIDHGVGGERTAEVA